jgi:microcystin-dependent protein
MLAQSIAIGEQDFIPNAGAMVDIRSTNKGVLIPRVTYVQRMYIPVNAESVGLLVYQTDKTEGFYFFNGIEWKCLNPIDIPVITDPDNPDQPISFATVAITGDYKDLINRPNIPQEITDLSDVAFSGDYADLKNKPNIPVITDPDNPDQPISFATVAITGSYNDLTDKPNIPSSLTDLAQVAFTGSFSDLSNKPTIPTQLSELAQTDDFRTINREEKLRLQNFSYNDLSNKPPLATVATSGSFSDLSNKPTIPTQLSELAQTDDFRTINREEKLRLQNFSYNDLSNKPFIPTQLRDLTQDWRFMTVTEQQIERWEQMSAGSRFDGDYFSLTNRPVIPTEISQLGQKEFYRTVNDNEKTIWNNKSNFSGRYNDLEDKPIIPTKLSDLQADDYYSTVSRAEKESWSAKSGFSGSYLDLTNKPIIPTDINQLAQSSPDYQTVSATQKLAWDNKSSFSGNYNDLANKPDLSNQALGINNGKLLIKQDGSLLNIFTANSAEDITIDISGAPTGNAGGDLSETYPNPKIKENVSLTGVPTTSSINNISYATYNEDVYGRNIANLRNVSTFVNGAISKIGGAPVQGDIYWNDYNETTKTNSLLIKDNVALGGRPTTTNSVTFANVNGSSTVYNNDIINARSVRDMIMAAFKDMYQTVFKEGMVMIWTGTQAAIPKCWKLVGTDDKFNGRFLVGAGTLDGDTYDPTGSGNEDGLTGGMTRVTLNTSQMPSHQHAIKTGGSNLYTAATGSRMHGVFDWGTTSLPGDYDDDSFTTNKKVESLGGGQAHENRPPYRSVYFLKFDANTCGW